MSYNLVLAVDNDTAEELSAIVGRFPHLELFPIPPTFDTLGLPVNIGLCVPLASVRAAPEETVAEVHYIFEEVLRNDGRIHDLVAGRPIADEAGIVALWERIFGG